MAYPDLFTQAQLEVAVGGADKLLELVDKQRTGDLSSTSCQTYISEIKAAARGEVYSILQVAYDPGSVDMSVAEFVAQNALVIGVYWTWHKSTGGMAVPPEVKEAKADAVKNLTDAKAGTRALGTDADVESNVGHKTVTVDSTGTRVLRQNMSGFC